MNNDNGNGQTITIVDSKTVLQALALINDCNKYKMDLTTNGVVITDAIKFVQTNKERLTTISSKEEENGKESKEPDYDEENDQLEEKQEEETGEIDQRETTNRVF
jgi:hypothetical protein